MLSYNIFFVILQPKLIELILNTFDKHEHQRTISPIQGLAD